MLTARPESVAYSNVACFKRCLWRAAVCGLLCRANLMRCRSLCPLSEARPLFSWMARICVVCVCSLISEGRKGQDWLKVAATVFNTISWSVSYLGPLGPQEQEVRPFLVGPCTKRSGVLWNRMRDLKELNHYINADWRLPTQRLVLQNIAAKSDFRYDSLKAA